MIWPALTWSPSSISSSTILAVILEATVAWRRATTYPEASKIEPGGGGIAARHGLGGHDVHGHRRSGASTTTPQRPRRAKIANPAVSQSQVFPDGADSVPRSMRS